MEYANYSRARMRFIKYVYLFPNFMLCYAILCDVMLCNVILLWLPNHPILTHLLYNLIYHPYTPIDLLLITYLYLDIN